MPTMIRGYNAEGESQVFEGSLPEGWGIAKPDPEPTEVREPSEEPADPPKRRRRSSKAQKD